MSAFVLGCLPPGVLFLTLNCLLGLMLRSVRAASSGAALLLGVKFVDALLRTGELACVYTPKLPPGASVGGLKVGCRMVVRGFKGDEKSLVTEVLRVFGVDALYLEPSISALLWRSLSGV